jgi:hypothetical protein
MKLHDILDEHAFAGMFSCVPLRNATANEGEPMVAPDLADVKKCRLGVATREANRNRKEVV